jgi:hypothetical protein
MKGVVCLLALILASVSASAVVEHKLRAQEGFICNKELTTFTVQSFDVTPWPITKNTNLNLKLSGIMNSDEQLATLYVNVLYGGQQFYVQKFTDTDTVSKGSVYSTTATAFLPGFAPSGTYGVQVELQNTAGQFLNCWQVNFVI